VTRASASISAEFRIARRWSRKTPDCARHKFSCLRACSGHGFNKCIFNTSDVASLICGTASSTAIFKPLYSS